MSVKSLKKLQQMGFTFEIQHGDLHYESSGHARSETEIEMIKDLLKDIKNNRNQVIRALHNSNHPKHQQVIAVDIETTGLDPYSDHMRVAAWSDGDVAHSTTHIEKIQELLANDTVLKVFHNATFDVYWLQVHGFRVRNFTDTLLMSQVINNKVSQDNALDLLVFRYLGKQMDKELQHAENWQKEVTEKHRLYCEEDAKMTKQLYDVLFEQIQFKGLTEILQREIAVLPAVVQLQQAGIPFDYDGWKKELDELAEEKDALKGDIRSLFNSSELNIDSPKQLKEALNQMNIGVSGTSDEVLAKYEEDYPVILSIRKYKKLQKRLSAFGDKLKQRIHKDGRIRGRWRVLGTNTGRMSCTSPNLQGLPTAAKKYVEASEGCTFIVADYSQVELRVIAQLSKDKVMMASYRQHEDLHDKTAAAILGKSTDEVTPDERGIAKTTNFGLLYGMTAYGLRKRIRATCGVDIKLETASAFRDGYFQLYDGIRSYQDRLLKTPNIATAGGRVWTPDDIPLGNIQRLNYPIQSTAAEGLKEALALVMDEMIEDWKLIAIVHDEIVLEVPKEDATQAAEMLETMMIKGMKKFVPDVPVTVDIHIRRQWKN